MVDKELCRETARRIENADVEGLFHMDTWGQVKGYEEMGNECNTMACAAGHVIMAAGFLPIYHGRSFLGYRKPGAAGGITQNFSGHASRLIGIRETPLFYKTEMTAQQMSKFFDLLADGWHVSIAEEKVQGME